VDTYNVLYFVCVVVELAGYRGVSDSRFDCCCSEFCHVTCFVGTIFYVCQGGIYNLDTVRIGVKLVFELCHVSI
jgi:hypothetical protein